MSGVGHAREAEEERALPCWSNFNKFNTHISCSSLIISVGKQACGSQHAVIGNVHHADHAVESIYSQVTSGYLMPTVFAKTQIDFANTCGHPVNVMLRAFRCLQYILCVLARL